MHAAQRQLARDVRTCLARAAQPSAAVAFKAVAVQKTVQVPCGKTQWGGADLCGDLTLDPPPRAAQSGFRRQATCSQQFLGGMGRKPQRPEGRFKLQKKAAAGCKADPAETCFTWPQCKEAIIPQDG